MPIPGRSFPKEHCSGKRGTILSLQTGTHLPRRGPKPIRNCPSNGQSSPEGGHVEHVAPIETRPYNTFRTTNSHVEASASGSAAARRHAICCTVKSTTDTLILCLANSVKGGENIMSRRQTPIEVMFSLFKTSLCPESSRACRTVVIRSAANKRAAYRPDGAGHELLSRTIVHSQPRLIRRSLLCRLVMRIRSDPAQATGKRLFERRHLYRNCISDWCDSSNAQRLWAQRTPLPKCRHAPRQLPVRRRRQSSHFDRACGFDRLLVRSSSFHHIHH